ncbi:MAG TPA: hypothetical protein VH080_00285 [Gemmatimonadaceae bacterium]|nr:hypothetical protein [Gemmatimonadaceae bacterium]
MAGRVFPQPVANFDMVGVVRLKRDTSRLAPRKEAHLAEEALRVVSDEGIAPLTASVERLGVDLKAPNELLGGGGRGDARRNPAREVREVCLENGRELGGVYRAPPPEQQTRRPQLLRYCHCLTTNGNAVTQLLPFGFFVVISMTPLPPRMP